MRIGKYTLKQILSNMINVKVALCIAEDKRYVKENIFFNIETSVHASLIHQDTKTLQAN